jgi:hypothetical protein
MRYDYGFRDWSCEYIRPKYKVVIRSQYYCFVFTNNVKLKKVEKQYFDFSKGTAPASKSAANYYTFDGCISLEEVEDIGMRDDHYYGTWRNCYKLHTIEKIRSNAKTTFTEDTFKNCECLVNAIFEGVLSTSLYLSDCKKLSQQSINSVFAIMSKTPTKSNTTIVFPLEAINREYETSEGANDGSDSESWLQLLNSFPAWNIALK